MRVAASLRHWLLHSGDGFLLPLVILAFFWQLGTPALFDFDEGAFSAATWEMLQRGDFIIPFFNGEPRFDKPILMHWLQALSVSAFGLHEWTLRLPSALAASAWVMATYYFAKPRMPRQQAILAAVMVATSAMIVIIGRAATADAVLNLLITLALFDIWRYWEQPTRMRHFRVFFWLGLGFLCAGLMAMTIPVLVSAFLYISNGQWRRWLHAVFHPYGLSVFLAVVAPWYVFAYMAYGQAFIDGFFLQHTVSQVADALEGHHDYPWYYLLALPLIIMPFSGLLLPLFAKKWALFPTGDQLSRFLGVWFVLVLVLFSFSSTQLPHYLLYGITPLLLLLAQHTEVNPQRWLAVLPATLIAGLLLFLPELLANTVTDSPSPYWQGLLAQSQKVTGTPYRAAAGIYLCALLALLFWPRVQNYWRLIGVAVLQTLFMVSVLLPVVAYTQQGAVKDAARFARHHITGSTIVMDGINMPSFTVYREAITPKRAPQPGEYVFSKDGYLQPIEEYVVVFKQGGLVLAKRIVKP